MTPAHHPFGPFFRADFLSFATIVDSMTMPACSIANAMLQAALKTQGNSVGVNSFFREVRTMIRVFRFVAMCVLAVVLAQAASAQESKAAKSTRDKLKQKGAVDAKEQGTKSIFDELLGEADKPIRFQIKNETGISNNTKLTFKMKGTLEEILNAMSDKFDFGWYVVSNEGNNKVDGLVIIRKNSDGKERGFEFKKKKAAAPASPRDEAPVDFASFVETRSRFETAVFARLRD
jgi:hypothetical protein